MPDVFHLICDVDFVSRWVAGGPRKTFGSRETGVRYVKCREKKVLIDIILFVALERGGVEKCGMTDVLAFF